MSFFTPLRSRSGSLFVAFGLIAVALFAVPALAAAATGRPKGKDMSAITDIAAVTGSVLVAVSVTGALALFVIGRRRRSG